MNVDSLTFSDKFKNDSNSVILDVRTKGEYAEGHIPGSKLIDIMSPAFLQEIEELDKSKNYYVYCRSGNRSYHAGMAMLRVGFQTVYNLQSGILDWYEPLEQGL
ncbi:MAG: rhodanese-like domain-containing protein [Ignavibacterium sp.]|nr:rhodanese-like domain-containing protein [Ignavibacterium sp.]